MSTSSGYWVSENGSTSDKDNVFYERVRTYSPVTKMVQMVDSPMSPLPTSPSPGFHSPVAWSPDHHQVQHIQEVQPQYSQGTIRRYIIQNPEQEMQQTYPQQTIRRYIVQNPEQEIQAPYQQGTIRRYIVQNPEQATYLKGANYVPQNNVIYEKTIRRVEMQQPEVEKEIVVTRRSDVSSVSEQVIEQNNQTKVTVQSEQEIVSDQSKQQNVSMQSIQQISQQRRSVDAGPEQLDARYFGELLAELSRKNNDLYSCLMQHVEKIGVRKPSESEFQSAEDIESLIPKGVSELTKQQIRYLLQMRQTSDKSMRMVLSTFTSLREELGHLQDDLNKLETDKKALERDLTFKDSQIKEYETILVSVREKNRQQQQELKDCAQKIRSLDDTIMSLRNADTDREYRLKELEYAKNAMQQENKSLRMQASDSCSSTMLQSKTEEVSKHYMEMINSLREEKDKEIRSLRTQITKFQHDVSSREGSSSDLQMRLLELTSSLEERESLIKRQQEELFRLRQDRDSKGVTKAIITKKYRNQYPILGLLSDYNGTSPVKDSQTIVIERTGEMWKHEYFTNP
ncbi:protein POF1B isoform 1-T1 [Discoglossus pictus]